MAHVWESEKDKLVEQLRDEYRARRPRENDSLSESGSFSRWADQSMRPWDALVEPDGVVLGEIRLTGRLLKRAGIVFAFILALSVGWLMAGGIIWSGYAETAVKQSSFLQTPFSSGGISNGLQASLPTLAFAGQEVVVHYEIDSDAEAAPSNTLARIMVSCLCPSSQWGQYRILKSGEGSFVLPVEHSRLFSVSITQSPRLDGTVSRGFYWWGVRNGQ